MIDKRPDITKNHSKNWYWMILGGIGWFWMVMDGTGWYWMILDGTTYYVYLLPTAYYPPLLKDTYSIVKRLFMFIYPYNVLTCVYDVEAENNWKHQKHPVTGPHC